MRSLISLSMLRGSSLLLLDDESEEVEKKSSSKDGSSLTSFRGGKKDVKLTRNVDKV